MTMNTRFVHTNIIAQDWKRLAQFYERVFGCTPVPPERELAGKWLEDSTGVSDARIHGVQLRLPGYGDEGPRHEIFQYNLEDERQETGVNRPGFAHIAFAVDNVEVARQALIAAGGRTVGKLVSAEISGAGVVTFVYVTDPEGNIIELQHWSQ